MLLLCPAEDDDIIEVDHTVGEVQLPQGILHKVLKGRQGITQPKGNMSELIKPLDPHCEGSILL